MKSIKSIKSMAVIAGVAAVIVMAGVRPVEAQNKEARGTVTRVTENALVVKAGAQELTFVVDARTHLEVRGQAKRVQAAQPGNPSPRVNDFFEVGTVVLVRYVEERGANHALDVSRVGSTGAGGGGVSEPEKIADGKVTAVTASQLTLDSNGHPMTFAITGDTDVLVRGASKATKAAGGNTQITTFVHAGDTVSISYRDPGGTMTATQVRVRIVNK